jgi:xanthosine utilization system XapX-like protein
MPRPGRVAGTALRCAAAALVLAAAACSGGGSVGTALDNGSSDQLGVATIRTGTEIGVLFTLLYNHTHAPITIDAITLVGRGLGTVVRPVLTQIAWGKPGASVPQSGYVENPPVTLTAGGCTAQALRPVAGYRLQPGDDIAVWQIMLALRPGRYNISSHLITYTQDGSRYQELITQGFHGAVTRHAPLLTTADDGSGGGCWRGRSRLLKGIPW